MHAYASEATSNLRAALLPPRFAQVRYNGPLRRRSEHNCGGPSINVLLDIALGDNEEIAKQACKVLKTQVFLYEADMERIEVAYNNGNAIAKALIESYAKAEFFTKLPEVEEKIEVVTFIVGVLV